MWEQTHTDSTGSELRFNPGLWDPHFLGQHCTKGGRTHPGVAGQKRVLGSRKKSRSGGVNRSVRLWSGVKKPRWNQGGGQTWENLSQGLKSSPLLPQPVPPPPVSSSLGSALPPPWSCTLHLCSSLFILHLHMSLRRPNRTWGQQLIHLKGEAPMRAPAAWGFGPEMKFPSLPRNHQPGFAASTAASSPELPPSLAIATLTSRWRQSLTLIPPRLGSPWAPCRHLLNPAECVPSSSKYKGAESL